ncbi:hypothetical protein [Sulfurimonas paralvinellae]|uniref:Uncharacterized protein n=1 Tax=Sulfurimonas paralvinellae TaxID=317658 RepID=A0A7M1B6W1_9BACT|nr:hypothetical protein [Sulfurimonas paralvinellae]QOP45431.1 hypothetical protein FM071_03710 [Sulfurimonas paralvinellae]
MIFSFAILGGILLNVGAYLTYKGKIYQAVIVYMFADLCWIIMAFEKEDLIGAGFIIVGTLFGLLAFLKMKEGAMRKSLNEDEK